jgi:hypothetical protein
MALFKNIWHAFLQLADNQQQLISKTAINFLINI